MKFNMKVFIVGLVLVLVLSMTCFAGVTTIKYAGVKTPEEVRPAIEKFEELNPDIDVEYERLATGSDEYMRAVDILLLAGDKVDVVMQKSIPEHWERAKKGLFEPLKPYMNKEGFKYDDVYILNLKNDEGVFYGLPFSPILDTVFINKDHLDEAGLPVPDLDWTWEDYREYAKKLTKGEGANKRYGSIWTTWGDPVHSYMIMPMVKDGSPLFIDEDTHALGHPALKEWLKYRYTLENVDKSQVPYYVQKSQKIHYARSFLNETASMLPIGTWVYSMVNNTEQFPHDFKTAIRPLPGWKDNPAGRSRSACAVLTINKLSEHKQAAYKFIRFLSSEGTREMGQMPAVKGLDLTVVVENLLGGDLEKARELWDVDSVIETFNSDLTLVARHVFPEEQSEIREVFYEAQEKYLVGGATLDEVVKEMIEKADKKMGE